MRLILLISIMSAFVLNADTIQDKMILKLLKENSEFKKSIENLRGSVNSLKTRVKVLEFKQEKYNNSPAVSIGKDSVELYDENSSSQLYMVSSWALRCRELPSIDSKIIQYVKMGDLIEISSTANGWGRTKNGFIKLKFLEKFDGSKLDVKVLSKELNLRKLPSLKKGNVVNTISRGEAFKVYNFVFAKNWYKRVDDGLFVYKKGVSSNE